MMSALMSTSAAQMLSHRMPDPEPALVHAGQIQAATGRNELAAVVSSGVAVCLWDPVAGVGGMSHFLLPVRGAIGTTSTRHGDVALPALVDRLQSLGARTLRARVVGGCCPPIDASAGHLGERNVAFAVEFLRTRGIPLVTREVGGSQARKVRFTVGDGAAHIEALGR
jgi:chemotaxis protein CheD